MEETATIWTDLETHLSDKSDIVGGIATAKSEKTTR